MGAPTRRFCSQKFTSYDNCVSVPLHSPLKQLSRVHSAIKMTWKDDSAPFTCANTKNTYIVQQKLEEFNTNLRTHFNKAFFLPLCTAKPDYQAQLK